MGGTKPGPVDFHPRGISMTQTSRVTARLVARSFPRQAKENGDQSKVDPTNWQTGCLDFQLLELLSTT